MPFQSQFFQMGIISIKTSDNRDLVTISGVTTPDFNGAGQLDPDGWCRDRVNVLIGPTWQRVDAVAPMMALATIYNADSSANAVLGIDDCKWAVLNNQVQLDGQIVVAPGNVVLRLSCYATIIGILA